MSKPQPPKPSYSSMASGFSPSPAEKMQALKDTNTRLEAEVKLLKSAQPRSEKDQENERELIAAKTKLEMQEKANQKLEEELKAARAELQKALIANAAIEPLKAENASLNARVLRLKQKLESRDSENEQKLTGYLKAALDQVREESYAEAMTQTRRGSMAAPLTDRRGSVSAPVAKPRILETDFTDMTAFWSLKRIAYTTIFSHLIGGIGEALSKIRTHLASPSVSPPLKPEHKQLGKFLDNFANQSLPLITAQESPGIQARLTSMAIGLILEEADYTPEKIIVLVSEQASLPIEKSSKNVKAYYGKLLDILKCPMEAKTEADPVPRKTNLDLLTVGELKALSKKDCRLRNISTDGVAGTTFFPPHSFGEFNTAVTSKLVLSCEGIDKAITKKTQEVTARKTVVETPNATRKGLGSSN